MEFLLGRVISDKWKHIRDAFATSLRKRSGDKRVKKYIYCDELKFLQKTLEKDAKESSINKNSESENEDDSAPVPSSTSSRKRHRKSESDETDNVILKDLETKYQPPPQPLTNIDEDDAFFKSVTPAVKKFTEDEKLEFRIGLLSLIKQIKRKRYKRTCRSPSSGSVHLYSPESVSEEP